MLRTFSFRTFPGFLVRVFVPVIGLLIVLAGCASSSSPPQSFGTYMAGRHVYDTAGVLSPAEITRLESHAGQITQLGAPTVIYLRVHDSTADNTLNDAKALMDAFDVQSAPQAYDGLVIFINLNPSDHRHGYGAIYAGAKHFQHGNLPQRELTRIYDDVMTPLLRDGHFADAIDAGLTAAGNDLANGPPPPSTTQTTAAMLARFPLAGVTVIMAGIMLALIVRVRRTQPARRNGTMPVTVPPDAATAPEIAGVLVRRKVDDTALASVLLSLIQRGAVVMEPARWKQIRLRLVDHTLVHTPVEEAIWASLERSTGRDGTISQQGLVTARSRWKPARSLLRAEMVQRGFVQPDAYKQATPLAIMATVALVLSMLGILVAAIGQEPWGVISIAVLFTVSIIGYIAAANVSELTPEGEEAGMAWRGYRDGVQHSRRDTGVQLDLDQVVPFALAMGIGSALERRLREAGRAGYHPVWLGPSYGGGDFYPMWAAFYNYSTSTGDSSGGGASAGGGGAAGGF